LDISVLVALIEIRDAPSGVQKKAVATETRSRGEHLQSSMNTKRTGRAITIDGWQFCHTRKMPKSEAHCIEILVSFVLNLVSRRRSAQKQRYAKL